MSLKSSAGHKLYTNDLCKFRFLDSICTFNNDFEIQDSNRAAWEEHRRMLISEILPVVGALWLSTAKILEHILVVSTGELAKSSLKPHNITFCGRYFKHIKFVASIRCLFGVVNSFHFNRAVNMKDAPSRVVDDIDRFITRYVVLSIPDYLLAKGSAIALGVALIDRAMDRDEEASINNLFDTVSRMLYNASNKAVKLEDEIDAKSIDGKQTLLTTLIESLGHLILGTVLQYPKVKLIAV